MMVGSSKKLVTGIKVARILGKNEVSKNKQKLMFL